MKTSSKIDLVEMVAARTGEKKELTAKMVTETLTALRTLMLAGDPEMKIAIHDFGVFEVKKSRMKVTSLNSLIDNGADKKFRLRTVFHPGKFLKERLKESYEK